MEVLHLFGTPEQKERWLAPLLEGQIRSSFAMTEPDVASSDATNIATRIERDGDDYVINGRKWWISGAADPRCQIFIVMGKTDPDGPPHRQQSMILVPRDTPGLEWSGTCRSSATTTSEGHCELRFTDVRVPATNLIAGEGDGFTIAQARLGPGPDPPLHAADRDGRAGARADVRAGDVPGRVRQDAGRAGRRAAADRRVPDGDRAGAAADAEGGLDDRRGRHQGARAPRSPRSR